MVDVNTHVSTRTSRSIAFVDRDTLWAQTAKPVKVNFFFFFFFVVEDSTHRIFLQRFDFVLLLPRVEKHFLESGFLLYTEKLRTTLVLLAVVC